MVVQRAVVPHLKVFFYVMGKALSGELSCSGTGLVNWDVSECKTLYRCLDMLKFIPLLNCKKI